MEHPLVVMEGIEKSFPGVQALKQGRFELRSGEVHALCGENGAGKSTLMKILAGIYPKDAGRVMVGGEEVTLSSPGAALKRGISIIHQELNLMPHLTVAQNIFIGREPTRGLRFWLDEQELNARTAALFERMHLKLDPQAIVGDLTIAMQQMVEIAKALSYNARVLIMDEPTAALTDTEIADLFTLIRQLRTHGTGIVHISHRLEELKQIADRVTVMRDGQYIDTLPIAEASIERIIRLMVGRTIYEERPSRPNLGETAPLLEVRGLSRGRAVQNVSFTLRRGEIVGISGLIGAGRTELARLIFGADRKERGEIVIAGRTVNINRPSDAVRHGIGYLSEDRKHFGLATGLNVEVNIAMAAFQKFLAPLGVVRQSAVEGNAIRHVRDLAIKTPSLQQEVRFLSGGNQQKVVIGKWLTADTEILIFDEPTRGIDVGAKAEIYKLMNELAARGKAILMISSELPEILRMSHRILVMCEGRLTGELRSDEATQERIMAFATQREAVL